jgi:alkane 1-monooxygenase
MVKPYQFLTFLVFTLVIVFSILTNSLLFPYLFVFVMIPLIDYLIGENKTNADLKNQEKWKQPAVWAPVIYLYALTHFFVLYLGLQKSNDLSTSEILILAGAVGLYTGGLGITVAHELCHKKDKLNRYLADWLLASVCYTHFATEHVRGHHYAVSTPNDPASARFGESAYKFLPRTLVDSFKSAWRIDKKAVLVGLMQSLIIAIAVFFIFGSSGLLFFFVQSFIAIILLELVNYVEHYGLTRKPLANGRYEVVKPEHSWNSSHLFSNLLLFNLQRHSDHHAAANLPYTVLKHHDKAPQLPSGYPGMILLALVPPFWFKVMNPKLKLWVS